MPRSRACRSTDCSLPAADVIRFTYDAVGNRLTESRPTGTATYAYDAADRLLTQTGTLGSTAYTHDPNGNLIQAGSRTYTFDLAGRVTSATGGGASATFAYDGAGKRISATRGAQTTSFTWDVSAPLPELVRESTGSGSLIRRYVYGADLLEMTDPTGTYGYHHDALGSVVGLSDTAGAQVASYDYEPFGAERTSPVPPIPGIGPTPPENPMRFTGEYLDPEGVYHLRARQYDPGTGRFLSTDPLAPALTDPYVSAYVYANNRPTFFVDPSGKRVAGGFDTFSEWPSIWWEGFQITPNWIKWAVGATIVVSGGFIVCTGLSAGCAAAGATVIGGQRAIERLSVTYSHGSRHLKGTGLSASRVEAAIRPEAVKALAKAPVDTFIKGSVRVGDQLITFHGYKVSDGLINVGTYYPQK